MSPECWLAGRGVISGSRYADEDYPVVLDVGAGCNDFEEWDLWADVDHDDGPRAVIAVWVEVSFVLYDDFENVMLDYIGNIPLEYIADGEWGIFVGPGDPVLDCDYPNEYHFLFVAEDEDGDRSAGELIN